MKYSPQHGWWLWWDDGNTIHRTDGTRRRHRIDYWAIPLVEEFRDIPGILSIHREDQLKARKLLWRRLRHGYYDRHYTKHIPEPPIQWNKDGTMFREPERVPRCMARCKDGHRCRAHVIVNKHTGRQSRRCKWHGGHATGPRSESGKALSLKALARGRVTRARRCAERRHSLVADGTVLASAHVSTDPGFCISRQPSVDPPSTAVQSCIQPDIACQADHVQSRDVSQGQPLGDS
jgi:hypothetical protein